MRFRFLWTGLLLSSLCSGRFAGAAPGLPPAYLATAGPIIPTDTLLVVTPPATSTVTPDTGRTLREVRVLAGPGGIDQSNPIHTEFINQRTLAKAACCNLSESFETNASVSVSYSDALTGAKQIQFLGLGGQYVQTTIDNMPALRGLAAAFGLGYIPGPWITGIDIGKGAGSVVNGYESISGQINVELQKPDDQRKLLLNGYVNGFGRVEGNVNWSTPLSKRWRMGVLGHASTLRTELDQNGDGFRDLPGYTQLNAANRYTYTTDRFMAQVGVRVLHEDRQGGQLSRFGEWRYIVENATKRVEFFSKTAVLYPGKPHRGLGLQVNGLRHEQTARIGFRLYNGQQRTIYANLIYQSIIGNTNHAYKAGISYLLDDYREELATILTNRTESVPGVFVEYTYTYPGKWVVVLGGRFDQHNLFGRQVTPRAHVKYTPMPGLTLRAPAGPVPVQRGVCFPFVVGQRIAYVEQRTLTRHH